jgi:uncharacterized membrane protein HdeD (DUF308 family)
VPAPAILDAAFVRGGIVIITNPFSPGSWTRDQIDGVSSGWWVLLITGIVSIVAGGLILSIDWSVADLAVFLGVLLVVRGIFTMFSVPLDGAMRGWSIALGLLETLVGIAVWVWPDPTLLVIAFFIGWWVLFGGIMTIAGAVGGRGVMPYWGWLLALGIVETVLGFWLLTRPGLTLVATVLAIGIWSIVYGAIQIALSIEIKHLPARADQVARDIDSSTRRIDRVAG